MALVLYAQRIAVQPTCTIACKLDHSGLICKRSLGLRQSFATRVAIKNKRLPYAQLCQGPYGTLPRACKPKICKHELARLG